MNNEIRDLAVRIINIKPFEYESLDDALQEAQWLAGKLLALLTKE